ncbi:CU044_5270 family protein [Actinomadura sp. NAK00032]|uniref:CU044_5270 family protein n=1 Tax=Actinomadura sp. NAK00032 TaxID=2742128 RepID=UPI00158FB1A8|nr:CU044_5270 family protein [Actinomadura sp. NAK00032]QKW33331.1 CU044_5270 family protein [Actinomadura sp. NAK00032]
MTRERDAEMHGDAGMNAVEDRLAEAMRVTAEGLEPPLDGLVSEGVARGRRRRLRNRASIAASAAAAAAVAAGALVVVGVDGSGTVPPRQPAVQLVSAAQVLGKAAQTAEARPAVTPRPGQWWYTKVVEAGPTAEHGPKPHYSENWIKLDGSKDASLLNGKLVIYHHRGAGAENFKAETDRLMSLPSDPAKLRALLYEKVDAASAGDRMSKDRDGQAFRDAAQMLWDAPVAMPPATQAALYRVLAAIPGVQVQRNVKDGAGRPAIALSRGFGEQFLLDPVTYQMVAQRTVNTGHNAPISRTKGKDPRYNVPLGTVMYSLTRVVTKLVDKAGQR